MIESLKNTLNEEQIKAITTTEGYVRVIAGAGSGKTKTLTYRFVYLVNKLGISTSNILCVTFTNKAANEMKKRIRTLIGNDESAYICTFHGFCVKFLREEINILYYPKNFIIIDNTDVHDILEIVYKDAGLKLNDFKYKDAREMIIQRKLEFSYLNDIINLDNTEIYIKYKEASSKEDKVFWGYLYEQKKSYALDFNDLINFTLFILENNPDITLKWQKKLQYIMVDEFQDVSAKQNSLVNILSDYHKNLFIVGDPDQTIYTWRGANLSFILNFNKIFPNVKDVILSKNYRSTPDIINASNSLIKNNKKRIKKKLISTKSKGEKVLYYHAKTAELEAQWIAKNIKLLLQKGIQLNDIAILYRSHFVSRKIEEVLVKEKIKYVLYSGTEFYKRKEIKDVLCYLRMIVNKDDISFRRIVNVPRRKIGKKRMAFIENNAKETKCSLYESLKNNLQSKELSSTKAKEFVDLIEKYSKIYDDIKISDLLNEILNKSGYEAMLRISGDQERLDNLAELKQSIFENEKNFGEEYLLEEYLKNISLFTNLDTRDNKESVKLMTIHTAKGLEFPYIFVCGLNEGIFPNKHADTKDKMEEERRLAYVAYTRAEDRLYLSDSEGMNYDGSFRQPSRFIFNIEEKFLEYVVKLDNSLSQSNKTFIEYSNNDRNEIEFKKNDIIKHDIFGIGKIRSIDRNNSLYIVKFDKITTVRNIEFGTKLELCKKESLLMKVIKKFI